MSKSNSRSCNHSHKSGLGILLLIYYLVQVAIICITTVYCITVCGVSIRVTGAIGIWVCYAADAGVRVSAIIVPRWVVAVGAEVLFSRLLILDLCEGASSQSHQNQKL